MVNKRISDGVGKKIVEALKKQSEIEINTKADETEDIENIDFSALDDNSQNIEDFTVTEPEENVDTIFSTPQEDFSSIDVEPIGMPSSQPTPAPTFDKASYTAQPQAGFSNYQQPQAGVESFVNELDNFEIPNNIAVLKKLITQLPKGVTRHTGAQIIRQTMEALGISMKSVLQEAQQVQEGLSNSAKECQATIQEYKKQIISLEKQAQNHQRQYSALNELISLFIQTGR